MGTNVRDVMTARPRCAAELEHDRQSFRVLLGDEYAVADRAVAYARLDVVVEGCLPDLVVECSKTLDHEHHGLLVAG
jgi:hypothetical protein